MMNTTVNRSERGSAGVKFMLVLVVLVLAANAGYNYVPVAYAGESFKADMQTAVVNGLAVPIGRTPADVIKAKIQKAIYDNGVPANTLVDIKPVGNVFQAHAVYTQQVHILPFGIYTYQYNFDYTAVPTGYLLKE
jgi:hypothetical protein